VSESVGGHADVPSLVIRCGERSFTASAEDAPIVVGRFPAAVQIDDPRISRRHVELECNGLIWTATDHSRNGMFVDGVKKSAVVIGDGLTIMLGDADGIPVSFSFTDNSEGDAGAAQDVSEVEAESTGSEYTGPSPTGVSETAARRVGQAIAERREELGLTQRFLAREKVVNASVLGNIEKGRSWPRSSTQARLEQVLRWPRGEISRIAAGEGAPATGAADEDTTAVVPGAVRAPLMSEALQVALSGVRTAIDVLPSNADPGYSAAVGAVLADLRRLLSLAERAARDAPDVVLVLSAVRRCYNDVMLRAARAPGATLGQRLFAARHGAELSAAEAAAAAGVDVGAVTAAETDAAVAAVDIAALEALITALRGR
jgi:transcriptional regulator with XRE-family HTH domain